ncbi:hypothetical protein Bbelb_044210 [Branchiostoma belcheri]|nr:hypothetical protein Bbelb_044210 [Branchiostoma belcheri]
MPAFPYGTSKALSALHLVVGVTGIVLGVAELFFKTREDARSQHNKALQLTVGDVGTPIIGGLWFLLVGSVGASLEPGGPNNKCKIAAYHVLSVVSCVLFAPAMGIIAANSISQRQDALECTSETCAEASGILGIQAAVIAAAVVEVCLSVTTATICCCWAPPSTAQVMPMSVPYTIQVVPQTPGPGQGGRLLVPQPQFYLPNQTMADDIDFKKTAIDADGLGVREEVKKTSSSQTPPDARDVGCNTQDKLIPWLGISAEELENARATLRPPPPKKAWAAPGAILRRITKHQNGNVWPLGMTKSRVAEKKANRSGNNNGPSPSTSKAIEFHGDIGSPVDDNKNESKAPSAPSPTPPPSPLPGVVID